MPNKLPKITETDIKRTIKGFLDATGVFNFPITQGIASYKGAPDRIAHYNGEVIYLEIKTPKGKLSEWQVAFQEQCASDGIKYYVVRSLEDLQAIFENKC